MSPATPRCPRAGASPAPIWYDAASVPSRGDPLRSPGKGWEANFDHAFLAPPCELQAPLARLCFVPRLTDPGACLALQFRHHLLHLQGNDGRQLWLLLVHGSLETTESFKNFLLQLQPPCPCQGEKWSLVALLFLHSIHLKSFPNDIVSLLMVRPPYCNS